MTVQFGLIGSYTRLELKDELKTSAASYTQKYEDHILSFYDLPRDMARHLVEKHGTNSLRVVQFANERKMMRRLHPDLPFMEGEVAYVANYELAEKPNDVIVRRLGIGIIDRSKAE